MPKPPRKAGQSLAELRHRIDRIDTAMHELLIERSQIIDRLITVKKTEETGSAFRGGDVARTCRPSRRGAA